MVQFGMGTVVTIFYYPGLKDKLNDASSGEANAFVVAKTPYPFFSQESAVVNTGRSSGEGQTDVFGFSTLCRK